MVGLELPGDKVVAGANAREERADERLGLELRYDEPRAERKGRRRSLWLGDASESRKKAYGSEEVLHVGGQLSSVRVGQLRVAVGEAAEELLRDRAEEAVLRHRINAMKSTDLYPLPDTQAETGR